jgi:hypothetical protein
MVPSSQSVGYGRSPGDSSSVLWRQTSVLKMGCFNLQGGSLANAMQLGSSTLRMTKGPGLAGLSRQDTSWPRYTRHASIHEIRGGGQCRQALTTTQPFMLTGLAHPGNLHQNSHTPTKLSCIDLMSATRSVHDCQAGPTSGTRCRVSTTSQVTCTCNLLSTCVGFG